MAFISVLRLAGLIIYSLAPATRQRSWSPDMARAVRAMIGVEAKRGIRPAKLGLYYASARRSAAVLLSSRIHARPTAATHRVLRERKPLLRQSSSTTGNHTMFPFWLIIGIVTILLGIFNRQILRLLGLKPTSEVFTTPNLKHSSRIIEQIGRWIVISLGVSFLVQGLGGALPDDISYKISFSLLGLSGLMILAIIGITLANWKAR